MQNKLKRAISILIDEMNSNQLNEQYEHDYDYKYRAMILTKTIARNGRKSFENRMWALASEAQEKKDN